MSATYAKTTENVTANTPETDITAKYHLKKKSYTKIRTHKTKEKVCT